MNKLTAHHMVRGWMLFCLFCLATSHIPAQICPDYPRNMDEVLVCFGPDGLAFEQSATLHNPVKFRFPVFLEGVIHVDFADGNGSVSVLSGDTKTITYPMPGQYNISWNTSFVTGYTCCDEDGNPIQNVTAASGNTVFQTNFNPAVNYTALHPSLTWDDISGATYSPSPNTAYPGGSPYKAPRNNTGLVQILYANPADPVLRKPLIIVDGFDPSLGAPEEYAVYDPGYSFSSGNGGTSNLLGYGSLRWDVLMTGRDESFDPEPDNPAVPHTPTFALLPGLIDAVRAKGYDIVFVDFADAGDYVQANAEFLIKVIERVNAEKQGDWGNVVLGASMGGVVARYALTKMEQEGVPHCVNLFLTLDSPHNGANIPLATQAFAWNMHASGLNDQLWNVLNTPAARQMLVMQLGSEIQAGRLEINNILWGWAIPLNFDELNFWDYDVLHHELYDNLGWPQMCRKAGIADGVKNGADQGNQGYYPGDKYYDASIYISDALLGGDLGTVFKVLMRTPSGNINFDNYEINIIENCVDWHDNLVGLVHCLYSMAIPADLNPCFGNEAPYKVNMIEVNEITPLPRLDNAPGSYRTDILGINYLLKKRATQGEFINGAKLPRQCFMPTWTALGMTTPLNDENLFVNLALPPFNDVNNFPNASTPLDAIYAPAQGNLRHVELDGGMVIFILEELDKTEASILLHGGVLNETYNFGKIRKNIPTITVNSNGRLHINEPGPTGFVLTNPEGDAEKPAFTTYLGQCGSTVIVENGGQFNIGALNKSQHGIVQALPESIVHIKPGGTLRLTSDQSALIIHPGATLILDPGAIVRLESPGAKIRVEGRLIVNGDIDFAGTGYFEFAGSNQLEYGPGYTTFRLAGAGIAQRFIRIESELRVPAGRNIDLRQGAVQIDGERLALPEGSGGSFTDIHFYGAAANGVQGDHSASFYASGCRFDGFAYPVHLSGGTGTARLLSCTLGDYTGIGVFSADRPQLLLEQCSFNSPWANDGVYSKYTTLVVQRQTTITGAQSGTYGNNGPAPNGDPLLSPPAKTGVRLEGGWLYWMDGGEISGADVGIANLDGYPTNVYMNHFATIRDCYAGIVMRGNATTGLVAMNCARLINNYYGIHGRDVALMIDPALFNGQSQQAANANVFIRPVSYGPVSGSEYFHICYGLKTPPNPVPATQNYWGSFDGANVSADPSPSDHKTFCYNPASTGGCGVSTAGCTLIGMNTAPQLGRQPAGCPQPGFVCEDPDGNCDESCSVVVTGGEASTVRDQFLAAMDELHNEDFPAAKSGFQPPADLWGPGSLSFSTVCRTYVDAARSLTDGAAPGNGEERRAPVGPAARLRLSPNPAAESVAVLLDGAEDYELEVWDMQGRLMYRARVAGPACRLDVAEWPAGLYVVKAGQDGKTAYGKLSVNKP